MEESYTNLTRLFVRLIKEKIEARDTTFLKGWLTLNSGYREH
ncbi:hypothetical protein [Aminipila terrae]|nr:hypothetical protein [Aminipila terrae]